MAIESLNMTFADRPVVQADPSLYPQAAGLANGYFCPLGPGPGIGYVLINRLHWDQIAGSRHQAFPLVMKSGSREAKFKALRIISAVKVSSGPAGDTNAVYMLKLADSRWYARMGDVAKQFNVRCPAPPAASGASLYYEDSLDSGSVYTWSRVAEVIWGLIPGLGSFPNLPYTPNGNPESFQFIGVSALDALTAVLKRIECTIAYNPLTDSFSIVKLGVSQSGLSQALAANSLHLVDAEPSGVPQSLVPETVRVYFHGLDQHYGTEKFTQRASGNWTTENAWHNIDVATGLVNAAAGSIVPLWDDLPAIFAFDGSLTNTSALNTRAAERSANYVANATAATARRRTLYSGVVSNILPGAEIKGVHWRNHDSRTDAEGLVTEVRAQPGLVKLPDSRTGMEDDGQGCLGAVGESLAPPDLARQTYPNFPPLLQLVAVDGSGGALTAHTDNVWAGHVYRTDPDAAFSSVDTPYEALEACWLALPNRLTGGHISGMKLAAGDRFLGRLVGSHNRSGDVRPLYEILRPENLVFAVTLSGSVASGGTASVTLTDGRTVTATNQTPQTLSAGRATCYLDLPTSTFYLTSATGGGGSDPENVRLFRAVVNEPGGFHGDGTVNVDNFEAFDNEPGEPGSIAVDNPNELYGQDNTWCLVAESPGLAGNNYTMFGVEPVAAVIEGYVYQAFTMSDEKFLIVVERAYQGKWPKHLGVNQTQMMIANIPRTNDPHDRGPYLFEGEFGAVVKAEIWPEADAATRAAYGTTFVYRSNYVECPEDSPVEVSPGAGPVLLGSDLYSSGGYPEGVASAHYFGG